MIPKRTDPIMAKLADSTRGKPPSESPTGNSLTVALYHSGFKHSGGFLPFFLNFNFNLHNIMLFQNNYQVIVLIQKTSVWNYIIKML